MVWSSSLGSRPAFLPSRLYDFRVYVLVAVSLSTETFLLLEDPLLLDREPLIFDRLVAGVASETHLDGPAATAAPKSALKPIS